MQSPDRPPPTFAFAADPLRYTAKPPYRSLLLTLNPDNSGTAVPIAPGMRHAAQRAGLASLKDTRAPLGGMPAEPLFALDERCCRYRPAITAARATSSNPVSVAPNATTRPVFDRYLYLFHVLVAFEWQPSQQTLQLFAHGMRAAADFLFDATDGQMTFGQVLLGGPELMDAADIQVLASTRLHPRSWVNGFNDGDKYTPIRVGRGLWNKQVRATIPWDAPEGYRTLAHEWGHYALNLVDEYLDSSTWVQPDQQAPFRLVPASASPGSATLTPQQSADPERVRVVVPRISLPVESIMAMLEGSSEIVPQQWRRTEHGLLISERIGTIFPGVQFDTAAAHGPANIPVPLPHVFTLESVRGTGEEALIDVDHLPLARPWAYSLNARGPRLIAQGSLEARAQTRRADQRGGPVETRGLGALLLGHRADAEVLLIGDAPDGSLRVLLGAPMLHPPPLRVQQTAIANITPYRDVTPVNPPVVTVVPVGDAQTAEDGRVSRTIAVQLSGGSAPDAAWVFALGYPDQPHQLRAEPPATSENSLQSTSLPATPHQLHAAESPDGAWQSAPVMVGTLDGQVLLFWEHGGPDNGPAWLVAEYSQGGGPKTHVHAPDSPISAGSSEGNVMLFFHTDDASTANYADLRVVTTRNYASMGSAPGAPRSYVFSLAATRAIPAALDPTVVMYFDRESLEAKRELIICHAVDGAWQPLPTFHALGTFVLAWPMRAGETGITVSALDPAGARVIEHLRVYSVPSGAGGREEQGATAR